MTEQSDVLMRIVLATSNPHKLGEIQAIFEACASENHTEIAALPQLTTLDAVAGRLEEPVEDGDTFEANAVKKAQYYADAVGLMCMADDSGLEVDALGGEPGIYSARYSGAEGPRDQVDLANNTLLLRRLADVATEQRTARFVCTMALCEPGGEQPLAVVRGTVEGRIILPEQAADPSQPQRGRGANGFGYDPLFFVPELGKTTAELPSEHKNRISHRGDASRKMYARLKELNLLGR